MAFECSYGGIPLCLCPAELSAWIERHISLSDLRETNVPSRFPGRNLAAAGAHRWPRRPTLRLGQFFYPVGASRWAEFHGLMTASNVRAVMDLTYTHADTGPVPQPFLIQSDADSYTPDTPSGVTTPLYLLPPRPLAQLQTAVPNAPPIVDDLYLVTLVDERYYWQGRGLDIPNAVSSWNWTEVIDKIATELQVAITATPDTVYGDPAADSPLWSTGRDNLAELLDRIAFNLGCLVMRAYDGTYSLTPVQPKTYPVLQKPQRIAGGEIDAPASLLQTVSGNTQVPFLEALLPTNVTVLFPSYLANYGYFVDAGSQAAETELNLARFVPWVKDQYLATHAVTVALSSATGVDEDENPLNTYGGNGMEVICRDAAIAYFPSYTSTTPDNATDLQDLAQRMADDYWNWLAGGNDEVYAGIRNWTPEPYHDLLFSYNVERTATTRVQRLPYNCWPTDFQHNFFVLDGPSAGPAIEVVKVDSSATPDGHNKYAATVQRWKSSSQAWDANAEPVWLIDPNGASLVTSNLYGGCRLVGFADNRKVYAAGQAVTGAVPGNIVRVPTAGSAGALTAAFLNTVTDGTPPTWNSDGASCWAWAISGEAVQPGRYAATFLATHSDGKSIYGVDSGYTGTKSVCEGDGSLHTWSYTHGRLITAP